jgi:hypothetical protein
MRFHAYFLTDMSIIKLDFFIIVFVALWVIFPDLIAGEPGLKENGAIHRVCQNIKPLIKLW